MTITASMLSPSSSTSSPEPMWSIETEHETGFLFWRRDSSRVKFRCDVQVLEFVREPDELKFMMSHDYVVDGNPSHPLVVFATCLVAVFITVVLPWIMMGSSNIIQ